MHRENAPTRAEPGLSPKAADVPACVSFDEEAASEDHTKRLQLPVPAGTRPSPNSSIISTPQETRRPNAIEGLPPFISPLPGHLLREDLEFLNQKGAFKIPPEPDMHKLLQSYVFSIHPFMPILDLRALFHAIYDSQGDEHISILLFQAIMFAGVAAMDLKDIVSMGFQTPKEAREHFYNRVNLLYELDVEPSDLANLQALLLMSWWYGR